jgi:hypothetical protein
MTLSVVTLDANGAATNLAASTVNRILAAVSSFYEYAILSGLLDRANPIEKRPDPSLLRVSERHRPFIGIVKGARDVLDRLDAHRAADGPLTAGTALYAPYFSVPNSRGRIAMRKVSDGDVRGPRGYHQDQDEASDLG